MKFGFLSLSLALSLAAITPRAQATETEWKCLSALQEELTRSNCVGKSYPVGAGIKADARGTFTCGFLHCAGEAPEVGTNFYAYRAFIKDRSGKAQASSLCFHVDGKTQAFRILPSQKRVNLEGYSDIVGPQACRLSQGIGLAIRQTAQGELVQITQVKSRGKNPDAELGSEYASHLCENAMSGKVYDAAYALGWKLGRNLQRKQEVMPVEPKRFITVSEISQSVPYFHNGLAAGRTAGKSIP
jgi:hypothetical protein